MFSLCQWKIWMSNSQIKIPLKYKLFTFGDMLIILHSVALIWKHINNNKRIGGKKIFFLSLKVLKYEAVELCCLQQQDTICLAEVSLDFLTKILCLSCSDQEKQNATKQRLPHSRQHRTNSQELQSQSWHSTDLLWPNAEQQTLLKYV